MGHILVEIGKRIAESRRSAGFTQEELANRLGVTPQALSKWEKGASSPDLEMLTSLCDILGVSADYLVGKNRKTIVENGNLLQQDEIWKHLWDGYQPLVLMFGNDVVPVFMEKDLVEKIVQVRFELAKEGILMPLVRVMDHPMLKPKEVMILAYQNILYEEELQSIAEGTFDYLMEALRTTVRQQYAEILNVDIIKDLVENLKGIYPALIDGIVPQKLSYGLILDVTRGVIKRGNGMNYFPKVLELLEHEIREKEGATVAEFVEAVAKQLEREDNFYVVMRRRQCNE